MDVEDKVIWINARVAIPRAELIVKFVRSSGPGGQNVNKTATKAEVRFPLLASPSLEPDDRAWLKGRLASRLTAAGEIIIACDEHRTQPANLRACFDRLARLLREGLQRPKPRRATRRTAASQRRRLDEKKRRSDIKRWRRDRSD
ncbi:MAG: alternative ribosome rescue aminoacyl-tRNA hydrolase ArfB [Planctomycetota bacterium]